MEYFSITNNKFNDFVKNNNIEIVINSKRPQYKIFKHHNNLIDNDHKNKLINKREKITKKVEELKDKVDLNQISFKLKDKYSIPVIDFKFNNTQQNNFNKIIEPKTEQEIIIEEYTIKSNYIEMKEFWNDKTLLHSDTLYKPILDNYIQDSKNYMSYKFGEREQMPKLKELRKKEDNLRHDREFAGNHKTRQNITKRLNIVKTKVTNIISDMHNKVSVFIAKNHETVLLPDFESSKKLRQKGPSPAMKRELQTISHFKFRTKLSYFCSKYNTKFHLVDEYFTSITCGICGLVKKKGTDDELGASEVFNCKKCNINMNRDIHAARNVLLRKLSKP